MSRQTVVVPYLSNGVQRGRAFALVDQHLKGNGYRVVQGLARPWSPAAARNAGAAKTTGDVLLFCDADTICPAAQLRDVVAAAREQPGLVYGYDLYLRVAEHGGVPDGPFEAQFMNAASMGCAAIRRDCFTEVGGFCESFVGWGYEDLDFARRCSALWPTRRIVGPVYHLWHPRSGDRFDSPADADPQQTAANMRLWGARAANGSTGVVDALIFSKDRACQLDLLFRSIDEHAAGLYSSVTVLWRAADANFARGYAIAFSEHAHAKFILETDFEGQVRHWLRLAGPTVSFLVDDDVFYRPASLGAPPWSLRGGDYDYPFSLDGNIYWRDDVEQLLAGLRFRNPNELEHQGHLHRDRLPFDRVRHFGSPCLVSVPANRVSETSQLPHMGVHEFDLNERYLAGERLQLPDVDGDLPAHAPLDLAFS